MAGSKIQIKNLNGDVLFEHEAKENTIKTTLEEAVKKDTDLKGASLWGEDLQGAKHSHFLMLSFRYRRHYLASLVDLRDTNLTDGVIDVSDSESSGNLEGGVK